MENNNNEKSAWDKFIANDRDLFLRPLDELDELYMTDAQRKEFYNEAVEELKLKIDALKKQKKKQK